MFLSHFKTIFRGLHEPPEDGLKNVCMSWNIEEIIEATCKVQH
jgi:hypothetical protein